jgi:KDO2-lipid IV(A) lauroyltransferase
MSEYLQYRVAEALSRAVPRRFAYGLSRVLADAFFLFDRRGRAAAADNLRRVLAHGGQCPPERDVAAMTRRMFRNYGKYLVDFFRFARLSRDDIGRLIRADHPEYFAQAHARGKGVLLVSGHIGNWEMGGAALAAMGYPVNAVALRQPTARLNDFFERYRRQRGVKVIPLGHAVRHVVEALRRGECVGLIADRDFTSAGHTVPFFGVPAHLPRGPAWIAQKTGATVVAGSVRRRADDTYLMRVYPPIVPGPETSVETLQQRITAVLEEEIRSDPSQWFMFEGIWERQAGGPEAGSGRGSAR